MQKLDFEMIPENMWYCNLRHMLSKKQWDIIRKDAYEKNDNKCAICNRKVKRLEAHELWSYDEVNKIQKLETVVGLCKMCHMTIHIGHSELIGKGPDCIKHYCRINKCSVEKCLEDLNEATNRWHKRNNIEWGLDLTWLKENYNFLK